MSYIGNEPSQTLASPTSQYFNGTGSQTAFTLNRLVNVSEDLEVFVNNIQQEPGVGKSYTATGSTLTFDAAPSAGTNNVYVVYRGLAEITTRLEHDANTPLTASQVNVDNLRLDGNTISSTDTNGNISLSPNGTGNVAFSSDITMTSDDPTITMTDSSGTNDIATIQATSGALIVTVRDGSADGEIIFKKTDGSATDETMRIDSLGRVTMPNQPSFFAQWNAGGDASLSANAKVPATTMKHNVGNHYDTSQYRFSAPVAGIYLFSGQMWSKTNGNNARFSFRKNGSTRLAQHGGAGVATDTSQQGTVIVSLNANDYVEMFADDFSHNVHAGGVPHTYWTGHLLG